MTTLTSSGGTSKSWRSSEKSVKLKSSTLTILKESSPPLSIQEILLKLIDMLSTLPFNQKGSKDCILKNNHAPFKTSFLILNKNLSYQLNCLSRTGRQILKKIKILKSTPEILVFHLKLNSSKIINQLMKKYLNLSFQG